MEIDTEIPAKENIFDKNKVSEFIIDETLIKVGSDLIWLWVAIEPKHRQILHIDISFERTMLIVAERLIASLLDKYGKHRCINGRWHMVSTTTMPVFETGSPYTFLL